MTRFWPWLRTPATAIPAVSAVAAVTLTLAACAGAASRAPVGGTGRAATTTRAALDPHPDSGAVLFAVVCSACHTVGHGASVGPDLAGITVRRDREWLARWITDPAAMVASDSVARDLVAEWNGFPMPDLDISDQDAAAIIAYLARIDAGEIVAPAVVADGTCPRRGNGGMRGMRGMGGMGGMGAMHDRAGGHRRHGSPSEGRPGCPCHGPSADSAGVAEGGT